MDRVLGAGMIHPNVLRAVALDPRSIKIRLRMGVERTALRGLGVDDLRCSSKKRLQIFESVRWGGRSESPTQLAIEFVEVDADVRELDRRLSAAGLEVEKIDRYAAPFSGVFGRKVLKVEKHRERRSAEPGEVDAGAQGTMRDVCGAPTCGRE